jgi:probable HAF family extracellular repeat protein
MPSRSNLSQFSAALCLLLIGAPRIANAITYTVTDLPPVDGKMSSQANAINDAGQVVGNSWGYTYGTIATVWNGTTPTALAPSFSPPSAINANSFTSAINNSGQVVGSATNNSPSHAVMWDGTAVSILGQGSASGINNSGQVVGTTANFEAVVWNGTATPTILGSLAGSSTWGAGINNRGQVVGSSYATAAHINPPLHAVIWNGTTPTDLGTLGGTNSAANAINNSGQVAGYSQTAMNTSTDAVIWNGTTLTDLGTLGGPASFATDINNRGQVVGYSTTTFFDTPQNAFIWDDGVMLNLNTLLDSSGTGWTLEYALGINNSGQIVGVGLNPLGQMNGFLLSPTPLPAALPLFASGLGIMGWLARRRKQKAAAAFAA